ncbi:hypothetical protein RNI08_32270, partial [Pseudomonas aeruginosa]|nr:hypothetical protein [Pseudomonas aeruginosa]
GTTFLVLLATARHEEVYLRRLFGPAYDDYARSVPRLIPALHLFRTEPEVTVRVEKLRVTFADGLVFLALIPLAEVINALHG